MTDIHFTFSAKAGFTDELTQFSAWYKLGKTLGYRYSPAAIAATRSSPAVMDFMGFNDLWKDIQPFPRDSGLVVPLPLASSGLYVRIGFRALCHYVKWRVRRASRGARGRPVLVEFRLASFGDSRRIFRLIEDAVTEFPGNLDLRRSYLARRETDPRTELFGPGERVLVHVRQGDLAVVPTPWNTHFAVNAHKVSEFLDLEKEQPVRPETLEPATLKTVRTWVAPAAYHSFLKRFLATRSAAERSIVVSSDGFARAFEYIRRAATDLGLSEEQLRQLEETARNHEREEFSVFSDLDNARVMVGETDENLFDFLHAALTADVIITSRQQRMMSKLLTLYGRTEKPATLVVLTRGKQHLGFMRKWLGDRVKEVIAVDADDPADPGRVFR